MTTGTAATIGILALATLLARPVYAGGSAIPAAQQAADLQAQFDQTTDAIRRAKLMVRISSEDFVLIRAFLAKQDNASALKLLERLRDDAKTCEHQLNTREKNPEIHPAGFKDLQIAMRQSRRRLEDLMPGLTSDEQPPFEAVRADFEEIDRRLIRQLFPHQPLPDEPAAKP